MEKATRSYREAAKIAAGVALALWLLGVIAWAQSPVRQSTTGPVLTFTPGMASTLAGTGTAGYKGDGGPATSAEFNSPFGVARDGQGNLYVADLSNSVVRKISADGTITTLAGTGTAGYSGDGGPATSAQLAYPTAVALDGSGTLYIADFLNSCIRKVDANGMISTLATAGSFVRGVVVDNAGNVYYSNSYEGVWKVDSNGVSTRVAGNGSAGYSGDGGLATDAQTSGVAGLALDPQGNLYFAEVYNSDIRKVDTHGIITTVAGNQQFGYAGDGGPATSARLNGPTDVKIDIGGNLYIADTSNGRVRRVNVSGTIRTIAGDGNFGYAGDGGLASHAQFAGPVGLTLDESLNLFIADMGNNVIREIRVDSTTVDFGTVTVGQASGPESVTLSNAGNADLNVSDVVVSGNFGMQTTCSANTPLPSGSECSVDVTFAPAVGGNMIGAVTISDDAAGNPHVINLKGQGYIAPTATDLVLLGQFAVIPLNGNLGVVTVDAMDANSHLVADFNGTVTLQLRGPSGFTPFSGQSDASSGVADFDLTAVILNVAGDYTITLSSPNLNPMQVVFTVAGNSDFSVGVFAKSVKVEKEGSVTVNATVTPTNGFFGSIALSCSGLPSHSTCTFAPAALQADGSDSALPSVVTISTGLDKVAAVPRPDGPVFLATSTGLFSAGLLGLVFAPLARRSQAKRTRGVRLLQLILVAIILCGGLVGCGGLAPGQSHVTPPGNYTVTVNAASNGVVHSTTLMLVVQ